MKRLLILSGLVLGAVQFSPAQTATFTPGTISSSPAIATTFSTPANSVAVTGSGASYGGSVSRPFAVSNVVSAINNRFDISVASTLVSNSTSGFSQTASTSISVAGTASHSSTSASAVNLPFTDRFAAQTGNTFTLRSAVSGSQGDASATAIISGTVAPLALGSIATGSVATAGSPILSLISTPSLWVFNFPGTPPTGTATINLGNVSAAFSRALDAAGGLSLHRDNVRVEVSTFLDGIQVGTTRVSATNTSLAPLAGTGSNAIAFNSIPSITLNAADLYNQTRALTVVTKLIGTAYFGNSTSLGDYPIAQSTFSGVRLQGVPEPATIAGLSLGLLAIARRRKNK